MVNMRSLGLVSMVSRPIPEAEINMPIDPIL